MNPLEKNTNPADFPLKITVFGGFSIACGDIVIRDSATRTHQLWHLIEYLILNRQQTVSQSELIAVLWPDDDIENPINALKNLIYRLRTTFAGFGFPFAKEMILYKKGNYQWNNALPCTVDAELFAEHCRLASRANATEPERMAHYRAALTLYTGDYLPTAAYEAWVIPVATYYRGLYFECVHALMALLDARNRYTDIEAVARKALDIDPFAEGVHIALMHALVRGQKNQQAMAHYSYVNDLFFRELGIKPSDAMQNIFRAIATTAHTAEADIGAIQDDLRESDADEGAFYCEYEVFKNMYRLEARTAARSGKAIFLCLLTVEHETEGISLDLRLQGKAMDTLSDAIRSSLRKGDVYARFSASQYVLMLPHLTMENSVMVMQRIIKKHKQTHRSKEIAVRCRVQPLEMNDLPG